MPVLKGEGISTMEMAPPPIPDLMAEYHNEQISLFGITGTPEELISKCPVPHENMTLEAKNMFLVMAMNEAGTAIKEEHVSYFQMIADSRNVELKVTVREEPECIPKSGEPPSYAETAEIRTAPEPQDGQQKYMRLDEQSDRAVAEIARAEDVSAILLTDYNDAPAGAQAQCDPVSSEELHPDLQMDEWLAQIQEEYASRQHELLKKQSYAVAVKVEEPRSIRRMTNIAVPAIVKGAQQTEVLISDRNTSVQVLDKVISIKETAPVVEQPIVVEVLAEQPPSSSELSLFTEDSEDKWRGAVAYADDFMPQLAPAEELPESVVHVAEVLPFPEGAEEEFPRITLSAIIPEYEFQASGDAAPTLIEQLEQYIEMMSVTEHLETEKVSLLFEEIKTLAQEICELQIMFEPGNTEEAAELHKLSELCEAFMVSLGIEYSQETLERFVHTLIAEGRIIKLPIIEAATFEPEDKGTHERKKFTLNDVMYGFQFKLPDFQLIGRYALGYSRH